MSNLTIEPSEGNVALVLMEDGEKQTASGLFVSEGINPIVTAKIMAVNPKEEWLKKGDIVFIRKANAQEFSMEFGEVKLALSSAVCAKIVQNEE